MHHTLTTLVDRLDTDGLAETSIIRWSSPVPSFGDVEQSTIATLGLNPSNREFVDDQGNELAGHSRRFHTLGSLGLESWSEADGRDLNLIAESCRDYFTRNPYDRWFKKLDHVIAGTGASFYGEDRLACHLDLIPYATTEKWMDLSRTQRSRLVDLAGDSLAILLRDAPVRVLILNGRSVVEYFQGMIGVSLESREMNGWSLPRQSVSDVVGVSYRGVVDKISGVPLGRDVLVLGYNHNLQSSFGVTSAVMDAIRGWIADVSVGALQ